MNNDRLKFERLKRMIERPHTIQQNGPMSYNSSSPAAASPVSYLHNSATPYGNRPNMGGVVNNYRDHGHQGTRSQQELSACSDHL